MSAAGLRSLKMSHGDIRSLKMSPGVFRSLKMSPGGFRRDCGADRAEVGFKLGGGRYRAGRPARGTVPRTPPRAGGKRAVSGSQIL